MNRYAGPSLVLSVLGARTEEIADRASVRVEGSDLTIGRAEQCDWVLHAHGVSRQHAVVRHINGLYFLEDRSTNGMLLNGTPLRGGEPALLGDGDLVQIDTFEILVAIESPVEQVARTTARRETRDIADTAPAIRPPAPVIDVAQAPSLAASLVPGEEVRQRRSTRSRGSRRCCPRVWMKHGPPSHPRHPGAMYRHWMNISSCRAWTTTRYSVPRPCCRKTGTGHGACSASRCRASWRQPPRRLSPRCRLPRCPLPWTRRSRPRHPAWHMPLSSRCSCSSWRA